VQTEKPQTEPMNSIGQDLQTDEPDRHPATILAWPFATVGRKAVDLVNHLGAAAIFLAKAFLMIFRARQIPGIIQQVYYIGARSVTIILLVGFFTGMVLGLQSYHALVKFGAEGALGTLVALSLIRELGPVLTAIMITARAGSAMTAEIGIQRISEQIDALDTMRIDPLRFLISPRIAASIISFPLLTALFDLIGILGGFLSGCVLLGVNAGTYFQGHNRRLYQSTGFRCNSYGSLLLPRVFYPHAHRQLRCQRCQPCHNLSRGALLRAYSCGGLYCDLFSHLNKD